MDIRPIGNAVHSAPVVAEKAVQVPEPAVAAKPVMPSVEAASAVQQPGTVPNLAQLSQAVKNINKALEDQSRGLEFSIDSESDRTIIKVVDQNTKQVIRQIPTEEVLEISKALDVVLQGLLIKQKA